LNENKLLSLPRPLPATLRRLLVDSNHIETVEDEDTFPARSQLTTLSLAGNQLHRVSATVLRRLASMQALDLSNNQLRRIDTDTFSANSNLRSLTLAKNPLNTIQPGAFRGLRSVRALTLSYVSTVDIQLSAADLLRPLARLSRLDLDNSPGVAKALLWTEMADHQRPSNVEELGLLNCDLTTLPRDFPLRFPRLTALRVSSSRWHCDRALMWFRDWLLEPSVDVRVQSLPDIRCATPSSVQHRPLVSLNDNEFVETTWTPLPAPKRSFTTPSATTSRIIPEVRASPTQATERSVYKQTKPRLPFPMDGVNRQRTSTVADDHLSVARQSSVKRSGQNTSRSTSSLVQSTLGPPRSHRTHARHPKRGNHVRDDELRSKLQLIIAAVTVGVTLIIALFIVAAIVVLWRRRRKPAKTSTPPPPPSLYDDDDTLTNGTGASTTPRTFIKYRNKNGILFFSTPVESPSTLTTTAVSEDAMHATDSCLIGETGVDGTGTIRYVLPSPSSGFKTRVYRWEDF